MEGGGGVSWPSLVKRGNFFRITDDAEAMELMRELEVLWAMESMMPENRTVALHLIEDHETHWILCMRTMGNKVPSENGYCVTGYAKRYFTKKSMQLAMALILEGGPVPCFDERGTAR
jgi:hypothetical protein